MNDDRSWFAELVRTHTRPAMKFANVLVHDFDLAEEIVQEAFTRTWASPRTPSSEVEFRRYLYRIITNLAHDFHRREARRATAPVQGAQVLNPLEIVDQREAGEAIRSTLQGLGLRERQAIYLRYFEDLSFAETARIMGAPQGTVRVIVFRALRKLRRHLAADHIPDQVAI